VARLTEPAEIDMNVNTTLVLLLLLQQPRRPWYSAEISEHARCAASDVGRIVRTFADAGWAVSFSATDHYNVRRFYTLLTIDGVKAARAALRAEYAHGDDPTLILFANSMRPPATLEGV
jgi:hypothetical protein